MDLEEIISKYNGIGEWIKKINSVTEKANAWQKTFGEGLDLLYPLSKKSITIPMSSNTSIIIAHRLWIHEYGYKREIGIKVQDINRLYPYKDEIVKNANKEKRDALRELMVLGKAANKIGEDRKIEKNVDIDIFVLGEKLSSYLTQRQEHIEKITVTFRERRYVSCKCIATKGKEYNLIPSRYSRDIEETFIIAQICEILGEICHDYYKEVQGYVEPNIKIAQQMEDAVIQFKVAKKLSQ